MRVEETHFIRPQASLTIDMYSISSYITGEGTVVHPGASASASNSVLGLQGYCSLQLLPTLLCLIK
jgi:hypothetical protein